jgi:hypothetical protein
MNCVDFPSMRAFRSQLPIAERNVVLKPKMPLSPEIQHMALCRHKHVIVHAGKHWQSKTFPKLWWDEVLQEIIKEGFEPVLIGKEVAENQGTVAVETSGCIDLRNKTSIMDSVWLLQNSSVVICNDSSPLHMAVSGRAWIGFIASAKHPDFISHWRYTGEVNQNVWSWRMKNLSLGGMWDIQDNCPNRQETSVIHEVDPKILESWLPKPSTIGEFCREKMDDYRRAFQP